MTLLTISASTWAWVQFIGPALNVIPAAIAIWWCSRMDIKKAAVGPIALIIYVGVGLVLHFGLQAIRAAGIIVVS